MYHRQRAEGEYFLPSKGVFLSLLVGAVLRSYQLTTKSLWLDESFCWAIVQFSFPEMIDRVAQDNHPPLYFILLKSWAACCGESLLALRGLSVLFGLGTIWAMWLFVRFALTFNQDGRLHSQHASEAAFATAILVAVSLHQVLWARDVRMYALGALLFALGNWRLFAAILNSTRRNWIFVAILDLAFLYTHYFAIFSIFAQLLFVLLLQFRKSQCSKSVSAALRPEQFSVTKGAAICLAIILVGFAPWVPAILHQHSQVAADYWLPPLTGELLQSVVEALFLGDLPATGGGVTTTAAVFAIGVLPLVSLLYRPHPLDGFLCLGWVVPLVLPCMFPVGESAILHPRYLTFAHLCWLAAAGRFITRMPIREVRWGFLVIVVINALFLDLQYWRALDLPHCPGSEAAVKYVDQHRTLNEPVVTSSPMIHFTLKYYTNNREGWSVRYQAIPHYYGTAAVRLEELFNETDLTASDVDSFWWIDGWSYLSAPEFQAWEIIERQTFREPHPTSISTTVIHYCRKPRLPAAKRQSGKEDSDVTIASPDLN